MFFPEVFAFMLFFLKFNFGVPIARKQMCSKFAYDEQLLEKMIRQEINVERMQNGIEKTQNSASNTLQEIKKTDEQVTKTLETLQNNFTDLAERAAKGQKKNEETMLKTFEELRNNLTNEIEDQRKNLSGLLDNIWKPSVAFFAHNVEDLQLDDMFKVIVFTTTTINEGSGYDTSTGIFTAPIGGIYQFNVHYCASKQHFSLLGLVQSAKLMARSSNYDKDYPTCSSFSAVLRVEAEERIWVKCTFSGDSSYALEEDSWRKNSFSGFLISK